MRKRTIWIAATAATVLIAGVTGVLVFREVRANANLASLCERVTTLNAERDDTAPVSDGDDVAVFVGDSYSQGYALDDPRAEAWTTLVAEQVGWRAYVNAIGGTGFASDGPCGGQDYSTRISDVLAHEPSVVVLQGSVNDIEEQDAPEAIERVLSELDAVERVVVVGPPNTVTLDSSTVDSYLRSAAEEAGREYVSTLNVEGLEFLADGVHLTPEGHEAYAAAIADQISDQAGE